MNRTITRLCIVSLLLIIATTLAHTWWSESRSDYDAESTSDGAEASAYASLYEDRKWGMPGTDAEAWGSVTSPVGASWHAQARAACGEYKRLEDSSDGSINEWVISDGFCFFRSPNDCGCTASAQIGTHYGPDPAATASVSL